MNKFARVMYGKISHLYETDRAFHDFKRLFPPAALLIDVSGISDVAVGYRVDFTSETDFNVIPPAVILPETLAEAKARKLKEIETWTEGKITSGFYSEATGFRVFYDSDVPTQITMQGVAVNAGSETLNAAYPNGCPVRGVPDGEEVKKVFYLNQEQLLSWCADLSLHIGGCKKEGWALQDKVLACDSVDEVNAIAVGGIDAGI